jgi:nucleotide-binding universal stress UspA family protein
MGGVVVGRRRAEPSNSALQFGASEAQLHDMELSLMHVWDLPVDVSIDLDEDLQRELGTATTVSAIHGPVLAALVGQHPDLLILARDPEDHHLSKTLRACVRHAPCPLIVVPATATTHFSRVVVGVSRTPASATALRWAAREAELHDAQLVPLHAWQVRPGSIADVFHPARATLRQERQAADDLTEWIREVIPHAQFCTEVVHGAPLDSFLNAAGETDLVVVGRTKHHVLDQAVHERIAEDLAMLLACPVAVIPS